MNLSVLKSLTIAFLIALSATSAPILQAQEGYSKREAYLRAAIVAGILRYTYLDATMESNLCVIGAPASYSILKVSYDHIQINGSAARLFEPEQTEELRQCQVIVAGRDLPTAIHNALASNKPKAILIICDSCELPEGVADIRLFAENDKIRFRVTRDCDDGAVIRYDSALLELAATIDDRGQMQ